MIDKFYFFHSYVMLMQQAFHNNMFYKFNKGH